MRAEGRQSPADAHECMPAFAALREIQSSADAHDALPPAIKGMCCRVRHELFGLHATACSSRLSHAIYSAQQQKCPRCRRWVPKLKRWITTLMSFWCELAGCAVETSGVANSCPQQHAHTNSRRTSLSTPHMYCSSRNLAEHDDRSLHAWGLSGKDEHLHQRAGL